MFLQTCFLGVCYEKISAVSLIFIPLLAVFSGCTKIGEKSASSVIVYGVMAVLAIIILFGYLCLIKKKEAWFTVLFTSVAVVNAGYFSLSISKTLEEALLANRISYLGSVFLPLSMLMIILDVTKIKHKKWVSALLIAVGTAVFFIAASPGYLDIYYKEVSLKTVNGVTVLEKVYGPWHDIYLYYLLFYFVADIAAIVHATVKKKMYSTAQVLILISAASINKGVWLLEQLVKIDFELLSVSYIISELFLLGLHLMIQETERNIPAQGSEIEKKTEPKQKLSKEQKEICEFFSEGLKELTPTEKTIYGFYIEGKTTAEIREKLNITENTLKYHNKNIYSKLGVSSRKELMGIAKMLKKLSE